MATKNTEKTQSTKNGGRSASDKNCGGKCDKSKSSSKDKDCK